jgi:hypothetical protein
VIVYFGKFFKNYRNTPNFWLLFSMVKLLRDFDKKMDWALFWPSFSETHLVTLVAEAI